MIAMVAMVEARPIKAIVSANIWVSLCYGVIAMILIYTIWNLFQGGIDINFKKRWEKKNTNRDPATRQSDTPSTPIYSD
jgi:hypothetical protein